ncbi:YgjV family protein [Marinobacter sp. NP-4(2019)]|uniref:YgjV family protein n=1 Tax=Marinobacter sp. NP-4(2019) TaxID=2488665 RepID=UPI000FC3D867|nr:YgjV family protein [Marinobacter sp. NP-4(2019)]AZT85617.1 YgjV family protein [Marinobacter sp. NP-4(2019)]
MTEFFADLSLAAVLGQICGLIALGFCIAGFANKNDDRLMVLLISANVAFALMFAFFQSWTAAALTVLVILRIALARKFQGSWRIMAVILAINLLVAAVTWQVPTDIFPLTAAVLGTVGMFMLRGIPLRIVLGLAALSWMLNNIVIGSVGGTLAEGMVLVTNVITIIRLHRLKKKYPDVIEPLLEGESDRRS